MAITLAEVVQLSLDLLSQKATAEARIQEAEAEVKTLRVENALLKVKLAAWASQIPESTIPATVETNHGAHAESPTD